MIILFYLLIYYNPYYGKVHVVVLPYAVQSYLIGRNIYSRLALQRVQHISQVYYTILDHLHRTSHLVVIESVS